MTVGTGSTVADLAQPFMPSRPDRRGMVVEAGERWFFDASGVPPDVEVVVWIHSSDRSPVPAAARRALARELALRTLGRRLPGGWWIAGAHPIPPRHLRGRGLRARTASALRSGVLIELTSNPGGGRVLDAVAIEAGASLVPGHVHLGAGGTLVARAVRADGAALILRLGQPGRPGDPAGAGEALERLARAGVPNVPVRLAAGQTLGVSWLAESTLPGRRPHRVTAALARQVAEMCAGFPAAPGPATALTDDLAGIASCLPERAAEIHRLAARLTPEMHSCPGIFRHGDLWVGNLLERRGHLTGVLDWDGTHPAAVPGADLVQLVATEALGRRGGRLGSVFLDRPWRSDRFRGITAPYWATLGLRPDDNRLDLAGIAWWASAVHGTLRRFPDRAADQRWVSVNVDPVLGGP